MYMHMYMYMYVCIYIYIYIYLSCFMNFKVRVPFFIFQNIAHKHAATR